MLKWGLYFFYSFNWFLISSDFWFLHLFLQCIFCYACAQQHFSSILVLSPLILNGSHLPRGTGFTWWKQQEAEAQRQQWWACLLPSALLHCNSDSIHKGIHLHWQSPSALFRQVVTQLQKYWKLKPDFLFKNPILFINPYYMWMVSMVNNEEYKPYNNTEATLFCSAICACYC